MLRNKLSFAINSWFLAKYDCQVMYILVYIWFRLLHCSDIPRGEHPHLVENIFFQHSSTVHHLSGLHDHWLVGSVGNCISSLKIYYTFTDCCFGSCSVKREVGKASHRPVSSAAVTPFMVPSPLFYILVDWLCGMTLKLHISKFRWKFAALFTRFTGIRFTLSRCSWTTRHGNSNFTVPGINAFKLPHLRAVFLLPTILLLLKKLYWFVIFLLRTSVLFTVGSLKAELVHIKTNFFPISCLITRPDYSDTFLI